MSLQDTIASDVKFLKKKSYNPLAVDAVYTPPGGISQPAVEVVYSNIPLTADEQQEYETVGEVIKVLGDPSDVSGWIINGTVTINSFDYQIAMVPQPKDSYWTLVTLRTPTNNKTKV